MQAEAAASHDRVALDRMLIEQLPQIVKEAAAGLAGANLSVLNGADGLSEIAAGLVAQGLTILDSVKKGLVADQSSRPNSELAGPSRRQLRQPGQRLTALGNTTGKVRSGPSHYELSSSLVKTRPLPIPKRSRHVVVIRRKATHDLICCSIVIDMSHTTILYVVVFATAA